MADFSGVNGVMTTTGGSFVWELVRVILVLILLVPLAYFATRLYGKKVVGASRSGALRVIEVVPLGSGRTLCLVDVAGRLLLLGVTTHQVNLITEISDPTEVDLLRGVGSGSAKHGVFQDILRRTLGRAPDTGEEGTDS